MSKQTLPFAFETPYLYGNHKEKIDIYIEGVGYWHGGNDEDSIEFDTNSIIDTNTKQNYNYLFVNGLLDASFEMHLQSAIIGHLQGLFVGYEGEDTTTDNEQEN